MARIKKELSPGTRLADYLTIGYLAMNCPVSKVRAVLEEHRVASQRRRGLPHEALVYFVLAMVLYANIAYEEVLRVVIEGLRPLLGDEKLGKLVVTKGAISQAREKVGAAPLEQLYREQVVPHGPKGMAGVWYRGLRVMALDGTTLDMPDEKANAQYFGYASASRGQTAYPQLRVVALAECGTHTLYAAQESPYATGEVTLAGPVIDMATPDMLVTADRNFYSFVFWQRACVTGAKLLFRVKKNLRLPREHVLADGSYLTTLYANDTDRRHRRNGIAARVIEYTLEGIPDAEPMYRLLTNWLVPEQAPALELAALYHRRWTIEQSFDELKVHLADREVILRSKRPELIKQEFYALLITHAAIRRLMTEAADASEQAAEDLSYIHAVRVIKRRLPGCCAFPP